MGVFERERFICRGSQFWLLLLAAIVLAITLLKPTLPLKTNVHRYHLIIDVTQSTPYVRLVVAFSFSPMGEIFCGEAK